MKKRKYQSEALMVIHQAMEASYRIGAISEERMRFFDEGCLVTEPEPSASENSNHQDMPVIPAYARTKA
jgi:DNA-binding transcriptional regulator YiaG